MSTKRPSLWSLVPDTAVRMRRMAEHFGLTVLYDRADSCTHCMTRFFSRLMAAADRAEAEERNRIN